MKRYKALNESEFHRMITEATMGVVRRVLQEVAGSEELPLDDYDYDYPEEEYLDDEPDEYPRY